MGGHTNNQMKIIVLNLIVHDVFRKYGKCVWLNTYNKN